MRPRPFQRLRPAAVSLTAALLFSSAFLGARPCAAARQLSTQGDLMQQALEAFLDERYDDAIRAFQAVLDGDRKNENAMKGLRSSQEQKRQQVERLRNLQKPALRAAKQFLKREHWVEAMDQVRVVLKRVPDHPEAQALAAKVRARVAKAHSSSKPNSSDWFYSKGVLAYFNGDWFQAATTWEQVYSFDPNKIYLVEKIAKARRNLEEQQREERLTLYKAMAWDNLKDGKYEESIKSWQDFLEVDPKNLEAQEGLRQAQEAAERDKVKRRIGEIQGLADRAMNAYVENNYKESLALWKNVLALDPENGPARDYMERINNRSRSGGGGGYSSRYPSAVPTSGATAYSSYVSAPPSTPNSGYQKALNLLQEERYPDAIEYLERYLEKNPDDARAKETLRQTQGKQLTLAEKSYKDGLMAYSQGQSPEAIRLWQSALRINPDFQKARQALIKALAESKRQ